MLCYWFVEMIEKLKRFKWMQTRVILVGLNLNNFTWIARIKHITAIASRS